MQVNNKFIKYIFPDGSQESKVQKAYKHNVMASLFALAKDQIKAETHYLKAKEIAETLNFRYSNLFTNLGNFYSQTKNFAIAEKYYKGAIEMSPFNSEGCVKQEFSSDIQLIFDRLCDLFPDLSTTFNSSEAFVDSHTNLGFCLLGLERPHEAFEYLNLALKLSPKNKEIQVNIGNAMRQIGKREQAIEYIWNQVEIEYQKIKKIKYEPQIIKQTEIPHIDSSSSPINFICVKWGTKYGAEYVNKLYSGCKRNFTKEFDFYCLTEIRDGLNEQIKILDLKSAFETWWTKAHLFEGFLELEHSLNIYIDLDVVIVGNIDFLIDYEGNFALMKTDNIACETKNKNGYNSSVILFRGNRFHNIFASLLEIYPIIINLIFRFDYWLEMIIPCCDFLQDIFPGKLSDYLATCKDALDANSKIVIFPRKPKPHDYPAQWIKQYWVE